MGFKTKLFLVSLPFLILALRRWSKGGLYEGSETMEGKTVIVTGANSGIGLGTAIGLAMRKARVILACRSIKNGEAAIKKIRESTKDGELLVKQLDLSSFKSIKKFAADINATEKKIDVLINNAGIFYPPQGKTKEGFEMIMGVNHFGTFLLTNLLLEKIKGTSKSRIITVSSDSHTHVTGLDLDDLNFEKEEINFYFRYSASKLANCLFSKELGKRLSGTEVGTYCAHPGMVSTTAFEKFFKPILPNFLANVFIGYIEFFHKGIIEGAQTNIYCAVAKEQEGVKGKYYENFHESNNTHPLLNDDTFAEKLWEVSEKLTGLKK